MKRLIGFIAVFVAAANVSAQDVFPSKPIRIVVPYSPGGADTQMRALQPLLTPKLGQALVIENVPGAGGVVAANQVKAAPADGYTLFFTGTAALTMVPNLRKDLTYGLADFVPVGNMTGTPNVVGARADLPYKSMKELIAYARANPGKVNMGSAGTGTLTHVVGAAVQTAGNVTFTHVPFKGVADAVNAMLGGSIDVVHGLPGVMMPHFKSGKLRPLAMTGSSRYEFLPEVPTLSESGVDFIDTSRFGLFAPKGLPQPVLARLAGALEQAVKDPEYKVLMEKISTGVLYHSPKEYQAVLEDESRRWAALIGNPKFAEAMK